MTLLGDMMKLKILNRVSSQMSFLQRKQAKLKMDRLNKQVKIVCYHQKIFLLGNLHHYFDPTLIS